VGTVSSYAAIGSTSPKMCSHCHLVTPSGAHDVCHACSVALRAEARRGLDELETFLGGWAGLERPLGDED
jgi:uncharacterized paraquat-inducible protein A